MAEGAFSYLDDLRRAYDRDAQRRHQFSDPPRFFSHCDDGSFSALEFEGFEVLRRELLTEHAAQRLHPQLLVLRRREA